MIQILTGDCRELLKTLPNESVHCVVTSPPYWGLRDYGTATWEGGDAECDHLGKPHSTQAGFNERYFGKPSIESDKLGDLREPFKHTCDKCGAHRIDSQIGLETSLGEYIETMVAVFREVRRVLRSDGTLWLNMGDSYAGGGHGGGGSFESERAWRRGNPEKNGGNSNRDGLGRVSGLNPKDLCGIPWRVAFALQADGWYLRQDIIWSKPNPMPESVTDRCTKAHEFVFLLAKGQWKSRVIKFADLQSERLHFGQHCGFEKSSLWKSGTGLCVHLATTIFDRAKRQYDFRLPPFYSQEWQQLPDGTDSDFVRGLPIEHRTAVWAARLLSAEASPKEFMSEIDRLSVALPESNDFLIGGSNAQGFDAPVVYANGKTAITVHDAGQISKIEFAHKRIVVQNPMTCNYYYDAEAIAEPAQYRNLLHQDESGFKDAANYKGKHGKALTSPRNDGNAWNEANGRGFNQTSTTRNKRSVWEIATAPFSEAHFATFPPALIEPCILAGCPKNGMVLDPFGGAGTTGLVADRLGRNAILIELNGAYVEMARRRIHNDAPLFVEVN